jgi:hypothetical protein
MTLNYQVIVERYPFMNEVVDSSIPDVSSSLYLTGKKTNYVGRKPRTYPP